MACINNRRAKSWSVAYNKNTPLIINVCYTFWMSHLKIIDFQSKRPRPSHQEAKERLDNLFQDFVNRGASPKETASIIFTYGVCELLSYSETPAEGADIIDEVLLNCFGIQNPDISFKKIIFTDSFVKDDDIE